MPEREALRTALAVLTDLPDPPRSGNHLRYLQNLRLLRGFGFEVSVVAGALRPEGEEASAGPGISVLRSVRVTPPSTRFKERLHRTASFAAGAVGIRPTDPFADAFAASEFDSVVLEEAALRRPQVVLLRSLFAHLAPQLRRLGATVVADAHDASPLMAKVLQAQAPLLARAGLALRRRTAQQATRALANVDELWVPSQRELGYFRQRLPTLPIVLVPNGIHVPAEAAVSPPTDELLLVGNFGWPPNLAAADALVDQILPRVRMRRPHARATLVGRDLPPDRITRWKDAPVVWEDFVDDVAPYFRRAGAFVFLPPPSARTALPLKLAEAFASATPVVASRGSTSGMPLQPGEHAIIGDDPVAVSSAVADLLENPRYRERLALAGHAWARAHLSIDAIHARLASSSLIARGY